MPSRRLLFSLCLGSFALSASWAALGCSSPDTGDLAPVVWPAQPKPGPAGLPPAISGGTLLLQVNGTAVAADPDRDVVSVRRLRPADAPRLRAAPARRRARPRGRGRRRPRPRGAASRRSAGVDRRVQRRHPGAARGVPGAARPRVRPRARRHPRGVRRRPAGDVPRRGRPRRARGPPRHRSARRDRAGRGPLREPLPHRRAPPAHRGRRRRAADHAALGDERRPRGERADGAGGGLPDHRAPRRRAGHAPPARRGGGHRHHSGRLRRALRLSGRGHRQRSGHGDPAGERAPGDAGPGGRLPGGGRGRVTRR